MVNDLAMDADQIKRHKFLVIDYRWTSIRLKIQPKCQRVLLKVLGLGRERKGKSFFLPMFILPGIT